jgi:hypothetical protein
LNQEVDTVMQSAAVQCVISIAKCEITSQFHEFVQRLFGIIGETLEVELLCHCIEALNALFIDRAEFIPHFEIRLRGIAESVFNSWEVFLQDNEEVTTSLIAATIELIKLLLITLPTEQSMGALASAIRALDIVPRLTCMTLLCMVETIDLLKFLLMNYPEQTNIIIQENELLREMLTEASQNEKVAGEITSLGLVLG